MVFDAAVWRQEQDRERDLWLAWHTAALSRAKKLPPLERLLRPRKSKALTAEEKAARKAEFEALKERMGKRDGRRD